MKLSKHTENEMIIIKYINNSGSRWYPFKLLILLPIIGLLVSCATVKTISDRNIDSLFKDLILDDKEIDKVTVRQVDITLEVKFWLREDIINPTRREVLFTKTRDYILREDVKIKINTELRNSKYKYKDRISIRFQRNTSNSYWVYTYDPEKKDWQLFEPQANEGN